MTVIPEHLTALDAIHLDDGGHDGFDDGVCLLEAVAYVAGLPHSDAPPCTCPILGAYGRVLNDVLPDDKRQRLVPLIPRLVGTADDGVQQARGLMAADWLIRVYTPTWLRLAGLEESAASLEALPRQASWDDVEAAVPVVRAAKENAWDAAWDAARDAAGDAAWAAARDAARAAAGDAAWDAARDAAGDAAWAAARAAAWDAARDAAGDAAWAAARDAAGDAAWDAARAAAGDAAWDAARAAAGDAARAAAGDALQPTIDALQDSAIELLDRMIDAAVAR